MKAFTIWQPWASLIMIGAKPYEFRPKSYLQYMNPPAIGERIVVHAGARPVRQKEVLLLIEACTRHGGAHTGLIVEKALPLLERLMQAHKCRGVIPEGAGLGTAVIGQPRNAAVIFAGELPHDSDRGDFNWAWPLSDHEPFVPPTPMRGQQGFWAWPEKVSQRLDRAIRGRQEGRAMTDEQLQAFLGIDRLSWPQRTKIMLRITPAQRALYENMAAAEREVELSGELAAARSREA